MTTPSQLDDEEKIVAYLKMAGALLGSARAKLISRRNEHYRLLRIEKDVIDLDVELRRLFGK